MPPPAALRFAALTLSFAFAASRHVPRHQRRSQVAGLEELCKRARPVRRDSGHRHTRSAPPHSLHAARRSPRLFYRRRQRRRHRPHRRRRAPRTFLAPHAPPPPRPDARARGRCGRRWALHLALATWLGATLVAFDVLARTRSARVSARLGALALPPAAVAQQERALGVSPVYWAQRYIRLLAIIPWLAVLCGAAAGAVLLREARSAPVPRAGSAESAERADAKSETLETLDEKRPHGEV
ncbi:hypothetical protein DFH11DRAFT_1547104 [Phellopilus nigrolimitatus]|nr:hypothetical protein DFH11DRAFT_1547104 [Phellopilus nigrolimitatus]